jgi:hypothetical protein
MVKQDEQGRSRCHGSVKRWWTTQNLVNARKSCCASHRRIQGNFKFSLFIGQDDSSKKSRDFFGLSAPPPTAVYIL